MTVTGFTILPAFHYITISTMPNPLQIMNFHMTTGGGTSADLKFLLTTVLHQTPCKLWFATINRYDVTRLIQLQVWPRPHVSKALLQKTVVTASSVLSIAKIRSTSVLSLAAEHSTIVSTLATNQSSQYPVIMFQPAKYQVVLPKCGYCRVSSDVFLLWRYPKYTCIVWLNIFTVKKVLVIV